MGLLQIQRQYERIPSFVCEPNCTECCGPVPFTVDEVAQIPEEKRKPYAGLRCQYAGPTGCEIYDVRPLLCRMFGSVDVPKMTCWKGCGPEKKLTKIQGETMLRHYWKEPLGQDPLIGIDWEAILTKK